MIVPIRIKLLGGLSVQTPDREISKFQTHKTGELLAFLALHMPRVYSREFLAELLWPECDSNSKRNRLNQAVSSLRRQLHSPETPPNSIIRSDSQTLALNDNGVQTDVVEFESSIQFGQKSKVPVEKYRRLRAATQLYRGELLEGTYFEWAMSERLRIGELYIEALDEIIKFHSRAGEPALALSYVHERLKLEPEDVSAHVQLLDLYLRSGRPSAAIRHIELIRDLITGSEHSVVEQIELLSERAQRGIRSATRSSLPKASSKVKPIDIPAPDEAIVKLPRSWDSFFGREEELHVLSDTLLRGDRLVTILGIGGSGKTRLANEVVWKISGHFEENVLAVSLLHVREPESVPAEILKRVAGPNISLGEVPEAALARLLNRKGPCVLLLDNLEHLIPAAVAFLADLLYRVPLLQLLCTSRQPLDIPRENQFLLQPLPVLDPNPDITIAQATLNPSIALFVSRAQSVKTDFRLTERVLQSVVELCKQLEGLPLAIELAASWVRTQSPTQILESIHSRSLNLASRRKHVSPRHRSMVAAIEGSYDLLSPEEVQVFLRLSCFSRGCTLEAAISLCQGANPIAALDSLVSKSMIVVEKSKSEAPRFSMLEVLQTFARDQLTTGLACDIGNAHAAFYLKYTSEAIERTDFVESVDREYFNILSALEWFEAHGECDRLVELLVFLGAFWESRGFVSEGIRRINRATEFQSSLSAVHQARLTVALSTLTWLSETPFTLIESLQSAIPILTAASLNRDVWSAQLVLGVEAHRKGEFELSRNSFLRIIESSPSPISREVARARVGLGNSCVELRQWDEAENHYLQAVSIYEKIEDFSRAASVNHNLANLALLKGQIDVARQWCDMAMRRHDRNSGWHASMAFLIKGRVDLAAGDLGQAKQEFMTAYEMTPEVSLVQWRVLREMAWVLFLEGKVELSLETYGFVDRMMEDLSVPPHSVEFAIYEERVWRVKAGIDPDRIHAYWNLGRHLTSGDVMKLLTEGRAQRREV